MCAGEWADGGLVIPQNVSEIRSTALRIFFMKILECSYDRFCILWVWKIHVMQFW